MSCSYVLRIETEAIPCFLDFMLHLQGTIVHLFGKIIGIAFQSHNNLRHVETL